MTQNDIDNTKEHFLKLFGALGFGIIVLNSEQKTETHGGEDIFLLRQIIKTSAERLATIERSIYLNKPVPSTDDFDKMIRQ